MSMLYVGLTPPHRMHTAHAHSARTERMHRGQNGTICIYQYTYVYLYYICRL